MRVAPCDTEATEDGWLLLARGGVSTRQIAAEAGLGIRRIQLGLTRARARGGPRPAAAPVPALRLVVLSSNSCKAFALQVCGDLHHGELPEGTCCYCPVCCRTGELAEGLIARMYCPPPCDPTEGPWSLSEPTRYVPDPVLRGGLG